MPYKNREDKLACQARYRAKNKEKLSAWNSEYYLRKKTEINERNNQWWEENKDYGNAYNRGKYWSMSDDDRVKRNKKHDPKARAKKYGISLEVYLEMRERPCAVCGEKREKMCIDHCHQTKIVRDTLCHQCNSALGMMLENPNLIMKLHDYARDKCAPLKSAA